jgi:hypothetical protein
MQIAIRIRFAFRQPQPNPSAKGKVTKREKIIRGSSNRTLTRDVTNLADPKLPAMMDASS